MSWTLLGRKAARAPDWQDPSYYKAGKKQPKGTKLGSGGAFQE